MCHDSLTHFGIVQIFYLLTAMLWHQR